MIRRFRERVAKIMARSLPPITETLDELRDIGGVQSASLAVRVHPCPPPFKLFVLNGTDAFFGFYPVREHTVTIAGDKHSAYDVMGTDVVCRARRRLGSARTGTHEAEPLDPHASARPS
jgi:hypothetical protein